VLGPPGGWALPTSLLFESLIHSLALAATGSALLRHLVDFHQCYTGCIVNAGDLNRIVAGCERGDESGVARGCGQGKRANLGEGGQELGRATPIVIRG